MTFFEKEFQRLAGKGVHGYNMIQDGDRILVGLSGGKDSLALLWFLADRRSRVPIDYHLHAVHLNMGYDDPEETIGLAGFVSALGVPYHHEDTDFAVRAHSESNRENPCFLCARFRRRRLFELARDFGCPKVALGHHRDDLNETLLLNILYSGEISTMKPVQSFFDGLLTVIRPLCMVPEKKIGKLVQDRGFPVATKRCPSDGKTHREDVKKLIGELARKNDKVRGNIFRALHNVRTDYLLGQEDNGGPVNGNRRGRKRRHANREKESVKMTEDQRKRTRVNFKSVVNLKSGDNELNGLATRDLSLKGLYVETDQLLDMDAPVAITLELSGSSSSIQLSMKGIVARVDKAGMAIDFTEVDLDSFYHLRNIVLYNSGDPAEVEAEIASKPAF